MMSNAWDLIFASRRMIIGLSGYGAFVAIPQIPNLITNGWGWGTTFTTVMFAVVFFFVIKKRDLYLLPRYYYYREKGETQLKRGEDRIYFWLLGNGSEIIRCTHIYYDDFVAAKMSEPNLVSTIDIDEVEKQMRRVASGSKWDSAAPHLPDPGRKFNERLMTKIEILFQRICWTPPWKESYYDY